MFSPTELEPTIIWNRISNRMPVSMGSDSALRSATETPRTSGQGAEVAKSVPYWFDPMRFGDDVSKGLGRKAYRTDLENT